MESKYDKLLNFYIEKSKEFSTMVETGTADGENVLVAAKFFDRVFTIENDIDIYNGAVSKFIELDNVFPVYGDSAFWLKTILWKNNVPSFIWLDAHYIGEDRVSNETPVASEIETILAMNSFHYVVIDDRRLFTGKHGYPSVEWIENKVSERNMYTVKFDDDFILFEPNIVKIVDDDCGTV